MIYYKVLSEDKVRATFKEYVAHLFLAALVGASVVAIIMAVLADIYIVTPALGV